MSKSKEMDVKVKFGLKSFITVVIILMAVLFIVGILGATPLVKNTAVRIRKTRIGVVAEAVALVLLLASFIPASAAAADALPAPDLTEKGKAVIRVYTKRDIHSKVPAAPDAVPTVGVSSVTGSSSENFEPGKKIIQRVCT